MTNREVIQLFAKYEPELILECFEDCYNIGKYAGYNDVDTAPLFWIAAWLTDEYDKNFFREQDVERLLEKQKIELTCEAGCPCNNCGFGWGQADMNGIKTCQDDCQKLKEYNKYHKPPIVATAEALLNKDQATRFMRAIEASEKWNEEHKK